MPLMCFQSDGIDPPLVFMHEISGMATCYLPLARSLGRTHPFYVVQTKESETRFDQRPPTVEWLADQYIDHISNHFDPRKCIYGGWSFGALLAYQIAAVVSQGSSNFPKVLMIDPPIIGLHRKELRQREELLVEFVDCLCKSSARISPPLGGDLNPTAADSVERALETLKNCGIASGGREMFMAWFDVFTRHMHALQLYEPPRYEGEVCIVIAGGRDEDEKNCVREYWPSTAPGSTIQECKGDHYSIMRNPHVGELSERVRQLLAVNVS